VKLPRDGTPSRRAAHGRMLNRERIARLEGTLRRSVNFSGDFLEIRENRLLSKRWARRYLWRAHR
jgi:hypothetical protein